MGEQEYRIDDLAREAGTTVRNVRSYQEQGLLPPPRKEGRVAKYGAVHLARLRLIGKLLNRGFTLKAIGDLIERWLSGNSLDDLLGLEEALVAPWATAEDEAGAEVDPESLFGGPVDDLTTERAVELGVIAIEDGQTVVTDSRLMRIAVDLVAEGVPLADVLDVGILLRDQIDRVSLGFVDLIDEHLIQPIVTKGIDDITGEDVEEITRLVNRLRPLARMAVDATLVSTLEERIADRFKQILTQLGFPADGDLGELAG